MIQTASSDQHYKRMWQHERDRHIKLEQENILLRKMIKVIFRDKLERMSTLAMGQIARWPKW